MANRRADVDPKILALGRPRKNDEARMTNIATSPMLSDECLLGHWDFVIPSSLDIRHLSLLSIQRVSRVRAKERHRHQRRDFLRSEVCHRKKWNSRPQRSKG